MMMGMAWRCKRSDEGVQIVLVVSLSAWKAGKRRHSLTQKGSAKKKKMYIYKKA